MGTHNQQQFHHIPYFPISFPNLRGQSSAKAAELPTAKSEWVATHTMAICTDAAADVAVAPVFGPDERHVVFWCWG